MVKQVNLLISYYFYYLRSITYQEKTYIGFTGNLKQRFADHNAGRSIYTAQYKPWKIVGFFGFETELQALRFERYLKSNAGRIFLRRYFSTHK